MEVTRSSWNRFVLLVGSIGPLGHLPASGTMTVALVGLPLYWIMSSWPPLVYGIATVCFIGLAGWIHEVGDRILGEKDSRKIVWDELAGFFVAVAFLPFTWQLAVLAFFLERALDITKIPPANWIERSWPGGWGVVGDDVVAGLYTLALLHLSVWLIPGLLGVGS